MSKLDKKIGIAIIGLGYWGPHYLRIFSQLKETYVSLACDLNDERLAELSEIYPHIPMVKDPESVFASPETEAVVIATPPATHAELALLSICSGKDVLIEKPMTLDFGEGVEIIKEATNNKRVLMVGYTFLYNPGVIRLKELVSEGKLGRIYYLHAARTQLGIIRDDVSAIWDLAPHDVSIFSYLLDQHPLGVSGTGVSYIKEELEDICFATLFYADGIIGNLHMSRLDANKQRIVIAVGSRARAVFDDLDPMERVKVFEKGVAVEKSRVGDFGEFQLLLRDGDILSPKVEPVEPLKNMCAHFVKCILERSDPLTNGITGLNIISVVKAIEGSVRNRGRYTEIEYPDLKVDTQK